jgi:nucleotide-binding universal stress UspA family protein
MAVLPPPAKQKEAEDRARAEELALARGREAVLAKVAADRDAGLIVMGLHSSPLLGPRMGSVTYRVLCLAHRLVLALPPVPATQSGQDRHESRIQHDVGVK